MNDKDTKAPVYIAIIIALLLVAAAGYYVLGPKETRTDGTGKTPVETAAGTPVTTVTPSVTLAPPPKVETIKCEICHTNPQDLKPHVEGGKLCINCHGSQVHNIHIGTGTVNLQCDSCHGFPPKIPTVANGTGPGHFSICEQCHAAPPDNLKPSYGNLVIIHLSRGKYCTNCHGTDVFDIHKGALSNASKK